MAEEYVMDAPYTWNYFKYQNPLLLSYVAELNGHNAPSLNSDFTYCDLGCGNGVAQNHLASIFPQGTFHGVDFNKEHIDNADACAEEANLTNSHFHALSFEQFCESDTVLFDFIVLHGVYSWVSADIRQQIVNLVDTKLKPGGLLYVSYNTLPGWAELTPIWKMMQVFGYGKNTNSIETAKIGLNKLQMFRDNRADYFQDTKGASSYLDKMLSRDPAYVAHEFCNGIFEPQYFCDVAEDFVNIGLDFAGTAKIHRNNLHRIVSSKFHKLLNEATTEIDRQSTASFIRNEFFRRDIYIRQHEINGSDTATAKIFENSYISAVVADYRIFPQYSIGREKIDLTDPLFQKLSRLCNQSTFRIKELLEHPDLVSFNKSDIEQAIHDLIAGYQYQLIPKPVDKENTISDIYALNFEISDPINRVYLNHRLREDGKAYFSSPNLGCAISLRSIFAYIAWALDGNKFSDVASTLKQEISQMSLDQKRSINIPENDKLDEWLSKNIEKFKRRYLPVLLKFEIFRTYSN